ncbi:hypothetical protein V5S96_01315 [Corynebacterium mastitidis]|uniref:Uncharacterized protein n=1 Tax=Corynebacterium mastitidis TaxID=161890 RepID=A0ABU8NVI3_9CORY
MAKNDTTVPAGNARVLPLVGAAPQPRMKWENGRKTDAQEYTPAGYPAYQLTDVLVIWNGQVKQGRLVTAQNAELAGGLVYAVSEDAALTIGARAQNNSSFPEQTWTLTAEALKPVSDLREPLFGEAK